MTDRGDWNWQSDAACRDSPAEMFFPERGDQVALSDARAVCADCPVRGECFAYAMRHKILEGVWGGSSGKQRREMWRRPRKRRVA